MSSANKITLEEFAHKIKQPIEELKSAFKDLYPSGSMRVTRLTRIDDAQGLQIQSYFERKKPATATANQTKQSNVTRKLNQTQVVEKKVRAKPKRIPRAISTNPPLPPGATLPPPLSPPPPLTTINTDNIGTINTADKNKESVKTPDTKRVEKKSAPAEEKKSAKKEIKKKAASKQSAVKIKTPDRTETTKNKTAKQDAPSKAEQETEAKAKPKVKIIPAAAVGDKERKDKELSDSEKLYQMQIQKQKEKQRAEEERRKKQEEVKEAKKAAAIAKIASPPKTAASSQKTEYKKEKKSTKIKIASEAVLAHKKKQSQKISQSTSRSQTAENIHVFQKPTAPIIREVKIPDAISVTQLANSVSLKSGVIIRKLMDLGMSVTANEVLDKETAWIIVEELGHRPVDAPVDDAEQELLTRKSDETEQTPRAPVVTVMGHVDHGKTSLLDYIRKTRVATGEAGGITQHIGAYRVESAIGAVTFIDTPGHALFTQMRARGAKITDIIALVVAADDGVKPQTIEAINHAKTAKVPIIVAANKMDKPDANLDRIKRELAERDVLPEDWGGDAIVVPISAATGEGVDELLNTLAMQTELLELTAPVGLHAIGVVIETRIDKGRGIVASLIITQGVLKRGDAFLCGTESGRVRSMWNASHQTVTEAHPSEPVEMQGLSGIPEAGSELIVVEDERKAREIATLRREKLRTRRLSRKLPTLPNQGIASLLDINDQTEAMKELNIVIKADVEGSREALATALEQITGKRASVKIVHSAVGTVTESDIYLAQTSNGVIVAFNIRPDTKVRKLAESRGIKIIIGNVVYELVERIRDEVLNLLPPVVEEKVVGVAEVMQVFSISKIGNIAGCRITEGVINARTQVRLLRDNIDIYEGTIATLRHFKDEAAEVRVGMECGIAIAKYNDIKVGDRIEAIERTETAPEM